MNIKELRPSKKSRFEQGYINPASCKKLFESLRGTPIIFRSSLEKKFVTWCETNPNVRAWGSECMQIRYLDPRDEKMHTYNPDFAVEMTDGTRMVVEIKPYAQSVKPPYPYRDDWNWRNYIKNQLKWRAAKEKCDAAGVKFVVVTERFFT